MALLLNKKIFVLLSLLFFANVLFAQVEERASDKEYKDPEQFDQFYKRRKLISAWQVNKLRTGALVVKLKTNQFVIDALTKVGNKEMADKKKLEALAINLNIMRAFLNHYSFSKVYFTYSHFSDTLLNGAKSGIFLDTNLIISPQIEMTESFYLIAETDDLYNSSIGFVPEDSARFVSEHGDIAHVRAAIIIKNKYGHQLKKPFPYKYYLIPINLLQAIYVERVNVRGNAIALNVSKNFFESRETQSYEGKKLRLEIPEPLTYSRLSYFVYALNDNLKDYYRENPMPTAEKLEAIKPFLY